MTAHDSQYDFKRAGAAPDDRPPTSAPPRELIELLEGRLTDAEAVATMDSLDRVRADTITPETVPSGTCYVQAQETPQMGIMRSFGHRAACSCGFKTSFSIGMDRAERAAAAHAVETGHQLISGRLRVPYERD